MEIKNKVTRGERERGIMGERRGRVKSRNIYKGPIDKDNGGGVRISKFFKEYYKKKEDECLRGTYIKTKSYLR